MTTRVTPIPADPWDWIPRAVEEFHWTHGRPPTRVRVDAATEAALEAAFNKNIGDAGPINIRSLNRLCGLTPEWDAERLEVL